MSQLGNVTNVTQNLSSHESGPVVEAKGVPTNNSKATNNSVPIRYPARLPVNPVRTLWDFQWPWTPQRYDVWGQVFCAQNPEAMFDRLNLQLWEEDVQILGNTRMGIGKVDQNGTFFVTGSATDLLGDIDPYIWVLHYCSDTKEKATNRYYLPHLKNTIVDVTNVFIVLDEFYDKEVPDNAFAVTGVITCGRWSEKAGDVKVKLYENVNGVESVLGETIVINPANEQNATKMIYRGHFYVMGRSALNPTDDFSDQQINQTTFFINVTHSCVDGLGTVTGTTIALNNSKQADFANWPTFVIDIPLGN